MCTPVAAISSVFVVLQTVQVKVLMPFSVQVGSVVTLPSSHVCTPVAAISSVFVVLQTMQVKVLTPFSVQVGSVVTTPSSQVWLLVFGSGSSNVKSP